MSSEKEYVLFRCPACGFYSLAPLNQKTRLCVRCGKRVTIDHFHCRVARDFKEAQRMLGELNSKREEEIPTGASRPGAGLKPIDVSVGVAKANKGLLRKFREDVLSKYVNKEVELTDILATCEQHGIPKEYALKLIRGLVDSGQAYWPRKDRIAIL